MKTLDQIRNSLDEAVAMYVVKYTGPDKSGKTTGPMPKQAADKKAMLGNKADKVGGKWEVLPYVKESTELQEGSKAGAALKSSLKKFDSSDHRHVQVLAGKLDNWAETGNASIMADIVKYLAAMDTEPREIALYAIEKADKAMYKSIMFKLSKKMNESTWKQQLSNQKARKAAGEVSSHDKARATAKKDVREMNRALYGKLKGRLRNNWGKK